MENVRIAVTKKKFYKKVTGYPTTNDYSVKNLSYEQIADCLRKGYAVTNIFCNNGKFHRAKEFFVSADFFAFDFDNDEKRILKKEHTYFSFDEMLEGITERARYILNNAFLIYTTQSHSDKQNKFRALFHLPERIKTFGDYERITKAFHKKFPEADPTCKEAARYFYGSGKNGIVKVLDNRLSQETIDSVIQETQIKKKDNVEITITPEIQDISDFENYNSIIENQLLKLKNASVGERNTTFNSVCYVIGSTISEMEKRGIQPKILEIENFLKKQQKILV